jgi:caffeoyl-CoA O-methyltransferase
VFIDADKKNYIHYYNHCLKLLRQGGVLAIDNTLWHGDVAKDDKQDKLTQTMRTFNDYLHADSRIILTLLPLGDGLTLAYKK